MRKKIKYFLAGLFKVWSIKLDVFQEIESEINNEALKSIRNRTLIVNLYGGPCCGKSTTAAGLFYKLKRSHVECELVREYAKDVTWLKNYETLKNQNYVTSKQIHRQYMVDGQVDVIITDSPILLGLVYGGFGCTKSFKQWLMEVYGLFDNMNILLERSTAYNPVGRQGSLKEAEEIDQKLKSLLDDNKIHYTTLNIQESDPVDILYFKVMAELEKRRGEDLVVQIEVN